MVMPVSMWGEFVCRVLTESRNERVQAAKSEAVWKASFHAAEQRVREDGACDEFFRHTQHWAFRVKGVPSVYIDPLEHGSALRTCMASPHHQHHPSHISCMSHMRASVWSGIRPAAPKLACIIDTARSAQRPNREDAIWRHVPNQPQRGHKADTTYTYCEHGCTRVLSVQSPGTVLLCVTVP